jgi:uncharacterized protein
MILPHRRTPIATAFCCAVAVAAISCARSPASPAAKRPSGPAVALPSGATYAVELATTPDARGEGLMYRESLPERHGMLFLFPKSGHYPFWMKNCNFPIDIVWISAEHKVVFVAARVPPCKADPCPNYDPKADARYVLEINAGRASQEGLVAGATVRFENVPPDLKVE